MFKDFVGENVNIVVCGNQLLHKHIQYIHACKDIHKTYFIVHTQYTKQSCVRHYLKDYTPVTCIFSVLTNIILYTQSLRLKKV